MAESAWKKRLISQSDLLSLQEKLKASSLYGWQLGPYPRRTMSLP